jgi:hypothetical protein
MPRKAVSILLAMIVLVGAMGLKTVVASHDNGAILMANGSAPVPPKPFNFNGSAPVPPKPFNYDGSARVPSK